VENLLMENEHDRELPQPDRRHTLRRWIVRAFVVGLAAGIVAGIAAVLN
jgi:hypothetical protein